MKNKIFFLAITVIVFFYSCSTEAPNPVEIPAPTVGTIEGKVISMTNGLPIKNVNIKTDPPSGSVVTDSAGKFKIENIEPKEYKITAAKQLYDTVSVQIKVIAGAVSNSDIIMSLYDSTKYAKGGIIRGTVTSLSTGSIISNVSISTSPATGIVTTNSSGVYELYDVTPGLVTVYAVKYGFDTSSIKITITKGTVTQGNLVLKNSDTSKPLIYGSVTGVLLDASRRTAISGANLKTSPATASVNSDSAGKYKIENISPGQYTITAIKNGYDTMSMSVKINAGLSTTANFDMSIIDSIKYAKTGTITGVVVDNTSGLPLKSVSISTLPPTGIFSTDNNGAYTIREVQPGLTTVKAAKPGYDTSSISITVNKGYTTQANFILKMTDTSKAANYGIISGIILNAQTKLPVSGVNIKTNPPSGSVNSDASGLFKLENVSPGQYTITAFKIGFDTSSQSVKVNAGITVNANFDILITDSLKYAKNGTIMGTIYDFATNQPVKFVTVSTSPPTSNVSSDLNGNFTLKEVPPGLVTVSCFKTGYDSANVKVTVTKGVTSTANLIIKVKDTIKVPTTGTISGVIFDAVTKLNLQDVIISTEPASGTIRTDSNGRYTLSNIMPGSVKINAIKYGFTSGSMTVSVTAGNLTNGDFSLTPNLGIIEGVVVDSLSGDTLKGVKMTLVSTSASQLTGNSGFQFKDLAVGNYDITAELNSYAKASLRITVEGGKTTKAIIRLKRTTP